MTEPKRDHDPLRRQMSFLPDDPESFTLEAAPKTRKRKPPKPLEHERKFCNRCNAPLDAAAGACPACGSPEFRLVPES